MHINGGVVDYALEGYVVGRKESTLYVSMPATFEVVSYVGAPPLPFCVKRLASCVKPSVVVCGNPSLRAAFGMSSRQSTGDLCTDAALENDLNLLLLLGCHCGDEPVCLWLHVSLAQKTSKQATTRSHSGVSDLQGQLRRCGQPLLVFGKNGTGFFHCNRTGVASPTPHMMTRSGKWEPSIMVACLCKQAMWTCTL
jgi:hypothetical protein